MDALSLAYLSEALRATAEESFEGVWPENWETVRAFVAVGTQWRVVALGGGFAASSLCYIGLDYAAVRVCLEAEDFTVTPELWRGLRVMEVAACAALNEVTR